eukprot:scaffold21331_cov117-Isochrysis_galbana.AAC.16
MAAHPGRVDELCEESYGGRVARQDGVGVMGRVGVDVADRLRDGGHGLDRQRQLAKLGPVIFFGRRQYLTTRGRAEQRGGQRGARGFVAAQADSGAEEGGRDGWPEGVQRLGVHEQRLDRVTGDGVVGLGVDNHAGGQGWVGGL